MRISYLLGVINNVWLLVIFASGKKDVVFDKSSLGSRVFSPDSCSTFLGIKFIKVRAFFLLVFSSIKGFSVF